jgi:hypothetical protein
MDETTVATVLPIQQVTEAPTRPPVHAESEEWCISVSEYVESSRALMVKAADARVYPDGHLCLVTPTPSGERVEAVFAPTHWAAARRVPVTAVSDSKLTARKRGRTR